MRASYIRKGIIMLGMRDDQPEVPANVLGPVGDLIIVTFSTTDTFLHTKMELFQLLEIKNGFQMPRNTPERWEELRQFPLRPDDVFIVTFPKSGTTWMQQIVKLLRKGGQQDDINLDRSMPWLEMLDAEIGKMYGYTPDMLTSSDVLSPRAFKSHQPYEMVPGGLPHTSPAKYIYIMRNPKDVCISGWYHINNMMKQFDKSVSWEDHMEQILSKETPFGGWFYHVLGWWKHNDAPNILFIKYEDMKTDPLTAIRSVAQFIGIELTDELLQKVLKYSSFASMKQDSSANHNWQVGPGNIFSQPNMFIRKGEIGGWREHFSEEQSKRFDEIYKENMSGVDLEFRFE